MKLSSKDITKTLIRLYKLFCVFVVRKPRKTCFLASRPIFKYIVPSKCIEGAQWLSGRVGGFRLFQQATLLIHLRLSRVSFLTDLYLECSHKDLRCLYNKTNMPEGKLIWISSTFFLTCKQETKYNISDITL